MAGNTGRVQPPDALTMPVVWVCVPGTSSNFRRCSLCLDKLGLSLRPLAEQHAGHSQQTGMQQAQSRQAATRRQLPVTETVSLPTASVLEIVEGAAAMAWLGQQQAVQAPVAAEWRPFSRAFGRSSVVAADGQSSGTEGMRKFGHQHMVGLRIHSAVAVAGSTSRGSRKKESHGSATVPSEVAPQDVHVALALPHAADVQRLVERLHEFRRYARALEFAPFLSWLAATATVTMEGQHQSAMGLQDDADAEEALLAELLAPAPAPIRESALQDRWRLPQLGLGPDGRPLWRQQPKPMSACTARWPRLFRSQSVS